MKILCGTDLTPSAARAAKAAGRLAKRMGASLRLVHVVDLPDTADLASESEDRAERLRTHVAAEIAEREELLRAEAARIRPDAPPDTAVLRGQPDEAIVAEAARLGATLLAVGALGVRTGPRWRLGSTADRVAQQAPCPVLIVRDAKPFDSWSRDERPLRVVVGVDTTPSSDAAVAWLAHLRAAGACSMVGAHVYWPPEQRERLHLHGALPLGKGHPEVDAVIGRELTARTAALGGGNPLELRIVGGLGRIADHLVQIAEDEQADLVVVGSHQRSGFEKLWHGSVSHGVIEAASMNVLCVPVA
jgi:nucleotide-binding universal stress UspA family protein